MNNSRMLRAEAIKRQGFEAFFYIMAASVMQVEGLVRKTLTLSSSK